MTVLFLGSLALILAGSYQSAKPATYGAHPALINDPDFTDSPARSNFHLQATGDLLQPYGWTTLTNTPELIAPDIYRFSPGPPEVHHQMVRAISNP